MISIRSLIILVVLLLGGGSLLGHYLANHYMAQSIEESNAQKQVHQELEQSVEALTSILHKMHILALSSSIKQDESLLLKSSQQPGHFFEEINRISEWIDDRHPGLDHTQPKLSAIRTAFRSYIVELMAAASHLVAGTEGALLTLQEASNQLEALERALHQLKSQLRVHSELHLEEIEGQMQHKKWRIMLVTLVTVLFLTAITAWLLTVRVAQPLITIGNVLRKITGGDYSVRVESLRMDEVGQIAVATNNMAISIERAYRELYIQRQQSEQIISTMGEGLVVVNASGEIVKANQGVEQLTGVPVGEWEGRLYATLFEDDGTQNQQVLEFLTGAEGERDRGLSMDRTMVNRDGDPVPIHLTAALLWSGNGQVVEGSVMVLHDMRELLTLESVKRANQAKDEFLASMSHELRTPLATIIGNCALLLENDEGSGVREGLDQGVVDLVQGIEQAGNNQLALVNDILDLSKIESGKFSIHEEPYNISGLIDEIDIMFAPRAGNAGLNWEVERYREPCLLMGDPLRIRQVLINLVGNAIKFTDSGEVSLRVDIQQEMIRFTIKDSGIGMDQAQVEQLFNRFEQADRSISRQYGGTGLGLYISCNLANQMGGKIAVTSDQGVGSTFELLLPYQPTRESAIDVDPSARLKEVGRSGRQFSGQVLIAEDTPAMQLLEQRILERMGLTVTVVGNGEEAVERAGHQPFDLILMDMQMPVMDGLEATRRIKQSGSTVPIIALTANVMSRHREQFKKAGCDGFLTKPIDKEKLVRTLEAFLSGNKG